jgi:hypothetical protein
MSNQRLLLPGNGGGDPASICCPNAEDGLRFRRPSPNEVGRPGELRIRSAPHGRLPAHAEHMIVGEPDVPTYIAAAIISAPLTAALLVWRPGAAGERALMGS